MNILSLLTALHLLVDGVCGAVLAIYALNEPRLAPIVYNFGLYTVFAFGLQGPVGYFMDRTQHYRYWLLASMVCLALGTIPTFSITTQAVLLGLGNCIFHVLGGSYVLKKYNTYAQLGIFVSSGAVGLGLGLNSIIGVWPLLGFACILTIFAFQCMQDLDISKEYVKQPVDSQARNYKLILIAILLLGCIVLRGFGSSSLDVPYVMLLPCTFALGKFLGGIICDRLGYKKTVLLIFLLGYIGLQLQGISAALLFILACNMTMPLTLRLAHWCRVKSPGLMFGLAASALVPGTIFKGMINIPPQVILVLQFLILFIAGYTLLKKEYQNGES